MNPFAGILSVTDTDTSTSLKSVNKILKKWDNFQEDDKPLKLTHPNTEDGLDGKHEGKKEYPKEIDDEVKFHLNRLKELLGNFDSEKILENIETEVDSNKKTSKAQIINKSSEDFASALSPLFRNIPADAFQSPVPQTQNKVENLFSANFSPRKQLSGANSNIVPFANTNKNQLKSQNSLTDDFECENEDEQRTNREIEPFILPSASKSKKVPPSPIKADDPEDSEHSTSTPNDVNKLTVHDLDTDTTPRGFRTNYANSNSKHKFSFGANSSMNVPNSGSQFLSPESGYNNLQNWSNRYSLGVNRFSVSTKLNFNNNTGIPVPNNRNSVVFQNTLANSGFPNTSTSQTVNLAATQNFNLGSTYDSRSSYLNLNNSFRGVINMNDPQPITPQYNTSSNAIQEALLSAYKSGAPSGVNSITSNCTATTNNTVFGAMTSDPTPPPPLTVNSFVEFSVVSVKRDVLSATEKPTRSSLQPVEVSTVFTGSGGNFDSAKESMIGNIYDYCFPHGAALKYVTLKEYNQLFPAAIRTRINSGDHNICNTSNSRANSYDNADNSGIVASAAVSKVAKAANIRYHIMQFTNENNVVNYATIVTFMAEFRVPSPALKDNLIELEMYALASNIIKRYIFYYQYRCKYLAKCEISRKWKDNITHSRNNSLDPTSAEYASLSSKQRRSSMSEASVSSHTTSKSLLSSVFHWVGHSKSTSQSSLPAAESTRSQHMSVPAKLSSIPKAQAPRNQRTLFERIAGKNKPTKHRAIRTSSSAYNIEFTPMSTEKVKHNKSKSCVETSSVTTTASSGTTNNSVSIADLSKELRAERNLEESNARKTRAYNRKEPITRTNIKNNNNSNNTSGDNSNGDGSNNTTPAPERKIYKQRSYSDNVLGGATLRLQTDLSTLLETSNEASDKTPMLHNQNSSSTADSQNSGGSFGFVSDLSGSFNLNNSFSSVGGDTNTAAKQKSLSSPFSGSFASMRSLSADQAQESNPAQKSSQFAKASRTNSVNAVGSLQRAEDDDASADSDLSRSYSYSEDSISISVNHLNSASDVTSQPMTGQSAATHNTSNTEWSNVESTPRTNTYNVVDTPTADGYSGLNISRSTSEDVYMRDQMQPMNSGNHSQVYNGDNMNESLDHCSSNDSSFEFNNTTHAVTGNASLGSESHCSVDDFRPSTGYGEDFPSSYATKYARHTSSKHQTVAVVSQYQKVAVVSEKAYCIISDKPLHVAFFEILEAIVEQECSEPENNSDDKREETLFSFLQYLQGYDFSDLHCMGQHYKGYHNSAKDRKKAEKAAQLLRQESFNKNISPRIYARNEDIRISFPTYLHKSVVVVPNKITLLEEWTAAVLFSIIPAEVVVKIVSMLLLEKSLLVCASDISLATAVSTAFAQLLRPFTWEGIFVPLLPFAAYEVLDAPVPYIIGVMAHTKPNVTVGPTTAILFIDDFLSSPDEYISSLETKIPHALHSPVKSPIGATQFTPGGRRSVVDHTDNKNNSYSATDTTPLHLKSMKHFQPPSVYEGSNSNIHLTDPASVTILRDLCVFVTYHARILRDSVQKPKCTTDTRAKRSPRNSDKGANKTHNMIKNIVNNITSEGVRSLRLILKRIFAHNAQLCGNVLTHMDGWLKFGAVNPVSNMFEFQPELFMEPIRLRMQYQENVIHTQMFVSFMDKQRVNYIQQTGLRLFLSDWIFYRLTVRKQRRTLHRRKLTVY